MLIIGHRGSAGTSAENSIASIREAIAAGVDILELDIRATKDKHPVLAHDFHLMRDHKKLDYISRHTLEELRTLTAKNGHDIVTLDEALKECDKRIFILLDLKERRAAEPLVKVVKKYYPKKSDWDSILISSFKPWVLTKVRKLVPHAQLSMLHTMSPFYFIAWHRTLKLSAVGFHRLHTDPFATDVANRLGLFTYVYTVNRPEAAEKLSQQGMDGVVTNYPKKFSELFHQN